MSFFYLILNSKLIANFRFHAGNTQKLLSEMSKEEKIGFAIDAKEINWRKYLQETHIPGLRKHVLNDRRM